MSLLKSRQTSTCSQDESLEPPGPLGLEEEEEEEESGEPPETSDGVKVAAWWWSL